MGMFRWRRHRSGSSDGRTGQQAISPKEGNAGETAIATLKVVLRVVNEVSDGFGPLKSVVSGLEFILKNVEEVGDNTAAMQMLLRRVKKISELTKRTDWDGEDEIHTQLTRDLDTVKRGLDPLVHQNLMERFVKSAQNAAVIREYIDNVEQILCDYQVCVTQDLHRLAFEQIGYDERNALDKLTRAKDAGFDASNHRSRCLAGTRVEVLSSIQRWAKDPAAHQVYWLNGHAGSGKTTIAQSVAERLSVLGELGASFFCSRDSQQQSDLKMIIPTLAFQLALANTTDSTQYRRALLRTLESNPDISRSSLNNQLEELIIGPAQSSGMTTVVLIDALDECRDSNTTSIILDLLASSIVRVPSIKFLITGRPEPHILAGFRLPQLKPITDVMILHEIDATSVNADIRLFLQNKLTKIAEDRRRDYGSNIPSNWPKDSALDGLTKKAAGLFIFASTVVKFIESTYHDPRDQLQKVLDNADDSRYEGSFGIDDLYFNILDGAAPRHDDEFLEKLRSTLGLLAITNDALLPSTIAKLLGVPRASDIRIILSSLRSLLVVPDDWSLPVCFHHQSFPDFLTDPSRCKDPRFLVNRDDHHFAIGQRCLKILRQRLKKNVCNLPRYTMNESVNVAVRDKLIGDATRYCCRYWADHLLSDVQREQHLPIIAPLLFHFLTNQQLQWFEALSLLQELGRAVESLSNMRAWMSACDTKYRVLLDWIIDGQKFVLYAFDIISLSVAHIYHSALPFAPTNSLLKKRHAVGSFPEAKVEIGIVASWSRSLRTIQIPTVAHALEYSRNGNMLAAGGNTVCRIFRSATGQNMMDLNSPGTIQSLSFSADNSLIATASNDHLRVWDVRTGAIVTELLHNDASLQLVEFHPILKHLLLSKTSEGTVRLWDVKAGRCLRTFELLAPAFGQSSGCKPLCWLKRGTKRTIAIAQNSHAEVCNLSAESPRRIRIFTYPQSIHIQSPTVASSDDGSRIALSTKTGSLVVYNIKSGALVHSISTEYTSMHSLRVLPAKGYVFASSRNIYTLYHNQSSRRHITTFQGHTDDVVSVTSSPDGKFIASGSRDKTIRIWEAECTTSQSSSDVHAGCHSQAIESAHFSLDGSFLTSLSLDGTISVWDTGNASCRCILPPLSNHSPTGHRRRYRAAAVLPGNEYVATVESTGEGKIWDFIGREVAGWSMPDLGGFEKIDSTSITPWGHDGLCGFFHYATVRSRSSSSKKGSYRTRIDCWTVQHVASAEQLLRVVLTARGEIPHHATHFHHTRDHQGSTTLILQDENDHHLKAILWDYTLFTGSCRKLEFVQDVVPSDGCNIAGEQRNDSTSSEKTCRKLVDHNTSWILDDLGRRILWIPPDHDGPGKWQRDKLLLEGRSGRLTVVDFSQAKLHDDRDSHF